MKPIVRAIKKLPISLCELEAGQGKRHILQVGIELYSSSLTNRLFAKVSQAAPRRRGPPCARTWPLWEGRSRL
jgi:hypothetical protein